MRVFKVPTLRDLVLDNKVGVDEAIKFMRLLGYAHSCARQRTGISLNGVWAGPDQTPAGHGTGAVSCTGTGQRPDTETVQPNVSATEITVFVSPLQPLEHQLSS